MQLITRLKYLRRIIALAKLKSKFRNCDNSFAGEYRYLKDLTLTLGIESGPVIDIAASDGYSQSCTLGFFSEGWSGLAVEMDSNKFSTLSYLYSEFPKVKLAKNRVTPNNVVDILQAFEINQDFSILNLDIDSYDLAVIDAILGGKYRPKVISMEINEKIPVGVYFSVDFSESHYWRGDHFYGCSLDAASHVVKPYGYSLVSLHYNNAFFVRNDFSDGILKDLNTETAYNLGYKSKIDRKTIFPWNADVESWQGVNPTEALLLIDEKFNQYIGLYTLVLTTEIG